MERLDLLSRPLWLSFARRAQICIGLPPYMPLKCRWALESDNVAAYFRAR